MLLWPLKYPCSVSPQDTSARSMNTSPPLRATHGRRFCRGIPGIRTSTSSRKIKSGSSGSAHTKVIVTTHGCFKANWIPAAGANQGPDELGYLARIGVNAFRAWFKNHAGSSGPVGVASVAAHHHSTIRTTALPRLCANAHTGSRTGDSAADVSRQGTPQAIDGWGKPSSLVRVNPYANWTRTAEVDWCVVTYREPERLALEVHALIERQTSLRALLEHRLKESLTSNERAEIERVIGLIDKEIAELQLRLPAIGTGTGGTGCRGEAMQGGHQRPH